MALKFSDLKPVRVFQDHEQILAPKKGMKCLGTFGGDSTGPICLGHAQTIDFTES